MTPETPAVPTPDGLYASEQLLAGWSAGDRRSYATTLDARTYRDAVAAGLRMPREEVVARDRASHDHAITWALHVAVAEARVVAFMGGHKLPRGSEPYRLVAETAWRLARDEHLVVSGGGPGAMEAAHLGARLARSDHDGLRAALDMIGEDPATRSFPDLGRRLLVRPGDGTFDLDVLEAIHAWQVPAFAVAEHWSGEHAGPSTGVPTWLYGHEPPTPLATSHAKYFENSIREDGLLAIATHGVVFAEGSAGTLQEVFQDMAQNHYWSVDETRSRMVFLDLDEFWSVKRPVRSLIEGVLDEKAEELVHFVTTADAAVAAIALGPVHR